MEQPLPVFDLGLVDYLHAQELQQRLRQAVIEGSLPGVLLLLEHPAVITLGNRGSAADLREIPGPPHSLDGDVPVLRSERGGAATLHAPGQLVSYPILPLPGRNLHRYVRGLEEVLLLLLERLGVAAERRPKRPGLYAGHRKIASLGLRVERWVASHGTSLNVSIDLSLFGLIVSCGEEELEQTSVLQELGSAPAMPRVKELYVESFRAVFDLESATLNRAARGEIPRLLGLTDS
jgi:lipoate-protein ligase B